MIPPGVLDSLKGFRTVVERVQSWGKLSGARLRKRLKARVNQLLLERLKDLAVFPTSPGSPVRFWLLEQIPGRTGLGQAARQSAAVRSGAERILAEIDEPIDGLEGDVEYLVASINAYVKALQSLVDAAVPAPAKFSYQGFTVLNPDGLSDTRLRPNLDSLDYLVALFKRRKVEDALRKGVRSVEIKAKDPGGSNVAGRYNVAQRRIIMHPSSGFPGRLMKQWFHEVFLHEFGHHIHLAELDPAAKAEWDSGWKIVKQRQQRLLDQTHVSSKDRHRFFSLIRQNGWDPRKAGRKVKGLDRMKFLAWLYKTQGNPVISTPKQVRLTPYGRWVFEFFKHPEVIRAEVEETTPPDRVQKRLDRMERAIKSNLGLTDYYNGIPTPALDAGIVDKIRSEDTSVNEALDALGIPSDYGRMDEQEDFAETFVMFMTNPSQLSKTAQYRMSRALWMSGFRGKPIMRLARHIAAKYLAV